MAIELTLNNVLHVISLISPILVTFFILMLSLFNLDIKGIFYLIGILLTFSVNLILMSLIKKERNPNEALSCNMFSLFGSSNPYNSPASSSVFIAFTMMYLILPMVANNNINYGVLIFFLCLFGIDTYSKVMKRCNDFLGCMLGLCVGLVFGALWYSLFRYTDLSQFLYFDELKSNRTVCSKPSKQKFVCSVYKNGQLIS